MMVAYFFLLLLFGSTSIMTYKYIKLKKWTKTYDEIGTGRHGFYMYNKGSYNAIVYVNEIDRFKDGYSKIKFNYAESSGPWKTESIKKYESEFISLTKTDKIEWLESEEDIKKIRKEKLENLKKL